MENKTEEQPDVTLTIKITVAAKWVGRIALQEHCDAKLEFAPIESDWDYYVMLHRGAEQMPIDIERVRQWLQKNDKKSAEQYVRATIAMLPPAKSSEKEKETEKKEGSYAREMQRIMSEYQMRLKEQRHEEERMLYMERQRLKYTRAAEEGDDPYTLGKIDWKKAGL